MCRIAVCLLKKLRLKTSGALWCTGALFRHEHLEVNLQLPTFTHPIHASTSSTHSSKAQNQNVSKYTS